MLSAGLSRKNQARPAIKAVVEMRSKRTQAPSSGNWKRGWSR
jgi:hypothetical protein